MKKLQRAAITLPVEPCPVMFGIWQKKGTAASCACARFHSVQLAKFVTEKIDAHKATKNTK